MGGPKREYIPFEERLAAALSSLLTEDERNALRDAQADAGDVIKLFELDHNIPVRLGGPKLWWNLTWLRHERHKVKTRRDHAVIAKARRVPGKMGEIRQRGELCYPKPTKREGGYPWPSRKLASRKFQQREK